MTKSAYIYALHRPGGEYRYIGATTRPARRMVEHRCNAKAEAHKAYRLPVSEWLRETPDAVMTVIAVCGTRGEAPALESYWIAAAREGYDGLLNVTDGGEGTPGLRQSGNTREKIGAAGRGRPSALRGRSRSLESRAKQSAALQGHHVSPETRAKLSAEAHARWHVDRGVTSPRCAHCPNGGERDAAT